MITSFFWSRIRVTSLKKSIRHVLHDLVLMKPCCDGSIRSSLTFHAYHPTPTTEELCTSNVKLAFELIQAAGMVEPPAKLEEIVAGDSSAVLRVLYGIYSYCAHMEDEQRRYEIDNIREQ
ncbi:unnamed protein product, partial [Schistosoma intercalatum]